MNEVRTFAAMFVAVMALGLAAFGVLRGLSATGPAQGVRVAVGIEPPIDAAAVAMAEHVVRQRVEEKGANTRVVPAGDHLIVEIGDAEQSVIVQIIDLIGRRGVLEIRAGDTPVLDPGAISATRVDPTGVEIDVRDPAALAHVAQGSQLTFVFDGKVKRVAAADLVAGTRLHVAAGGLTDDAAVRVADELVGVIENGAVRPLRIDRQEPFTRATGFLPRAWPFLVAGGVLLVGAALIGFLRGPRKLPRGAKPAA